MQKLNNLPKCFKAVRKKKKALSIKKSFANFDINVNVFLNDFPR